MNVTENREGLFKAISAAQGEFTTVEKNARNPHFNSKFAPLDSIIEMIRPILPRHGLSVVQFTDIPEGGGGIIVETIITHESGQYISGKLFMPAVKQDPQGYGSAITYGRRYALGAALGIVSDEDVDGNQGEGDKGKGKGTKETGEEGGKSGAQAATSTGGDVSPDCISEAQRKMIFAKMKAAGMDPATLKDKFGVTSSALLKKSQMNDVLAWIDAGGKVEPTTCKGCDGILEENKCWNVNCGEFAG